jgi:hypothetical protein
MMKTHVHMAACAAVVSIAPVAMAEFYSDPAGDQGPGNTNLDIIEINVSNDATDLMIDITTTSFEAWTKYLVFLDYMDGGITGNSNGWFRNVDMGANAIDAFAGIWADGGGGSQTFTNDGSNWNETGGGSVSGISGNTVSLMFSMDALGIGVGDVIKFDIGTSGGENGDPATDLVSIGSVSGNWGGGSVAGDLRSYTVVPAPGALALLGLAGGIAMRRRRA